MKEDDVQLGTEENDKADHRREAVHTNTNTSSNTNTNTKFKTDHRRKAIIVQAMQID